MSDQSKFATSGLSSNGKKPDLPTWSSARVAKLKEQEREKQRQKQKQRDEDQHRRQSEQQKQHIEISQPASSAPAFASTPEKSELAQSRSINSITGRGSGISHADLVQSHRGGSSIRPTSLKNSSSASRWANVEQPEKSIKANSEPQRAGRSIERSHHDSKSISTIGDPTSQPSSSSPSYRSGSSIYSSSSRKSALSSSSSINGISDPSSSPFKRNTSKPLGGETNLIELLSSPSRGIDRVANSFRLGSEGGHHMAEGSREEIKDLTHHPTQHLFRDYISKKIRSHASAFTTTSPADASDAAHASSTSPSSRANSPNKLSKVQSNPRLLNHFEILALPPGLQNSSPAASDQPSTSKRRNSLRLAIDKERGSLEEILLLIRKLREGIVASHREVDLFVIDVYCLSTYISLLVGNHSQLKSSLNRLVLELYPVLLSSSTALQSPSQVLSHTYKEDLDILLGDCTLPIFSSTLSITEEFHHLSSILLLSVSCLPSGSGTLGAYSEDKSRGQKLEFSNLRRRIEGTLAQFQLDSSSSSTFPRLSVTDSIVEGLDRDDGSRISRSLSRRSESYELSVFQRLLVLQKLKVVRNNSWDILKKGYLSVGLPLPSPASEAGSSPHSTSINKSSGGSSEVTEAEHHSSWIERILLLDLNMVPPISEEWLEFEEVKQVQLRKTRKGPADAPDDWDVSDASSGINEINLTKDNTFPELDQLFHIRMRRLGSFLETVVPAPPKPNAPSTSQPEQIGSDENRQKVARLKRLREHFIPEPWKEKISISFEGNSWSLSLR